MQVLESLAAVLGPIAILVVPPVIMRLHGWGDE